MAAVSTAFATSWHATSRATRSRLGRYRRHFYDWNNTTTARSVSQNSLRWIRQDSALAAAAAAAAGSVSRHVSTITREEEEDDDEDKRIRGIQMDPNSIGRHILPGDFVIRKSPQTGKERKIVTDRAYGYFWMMKDLEETNSKPIVSNETLIPAKQAQVFPTLENLTTLTDETVVDLLQFVLRNNRTKDAAAQCTLVVISYRDFGFRLLPSWTIPFEDALCSSSSNNDDNDDGRRFEVVRLSIVEGWLFQTLLRPLIGRQVRRNTPQSQRAATLLKFGSVPEFTDALRMHNTLTGYAFLLDGLGRVRFAGSGKASDDEAARLVQMARELTRSSTTTGGGSGATQTPRQHSSSSSKRGRNFRRNG